MSQIIEDAKKTAIAEHEKTAFHNTPDPKGDGGKGKDEDAVPEDVAFVQGINFGTRTADSAKSVRDYYSN